MSELKLEQIGHPDAVSNSLTFDSDGTLATTTGFSSGGLKVKSSGGGTFSINPPSSASDRTLTLPDEAGTVLTSGSALSSFPSGFANGITMADQFRLTTGVTTNTDPITNLERVDDALFSKIGTGMSESSGVFTFPTTGVYVIRVQANVKTFVVDFVQLRTLMSDDTGGSYNQMASVRGATINTASGSFTEHTGYSEAIVNVTSASTFRCKFTAESVGTGTEIKGSTDENRTSFTFIRLGDAQ